MRGAFSCQLPSSKRLLTASASARRRRLNGTGPQSMLSTAAAPACSAGVPHSSPGPAAAAAVVPVVADRLAG